MTQTELSIRKKEIEIFLTEHGTIEDGNNLYVIDYNSLRLELSCLEKFENEVCSLDLISDKEIFQEWLKKKNTSFLTKIMNKLLFLKKGKQKSKI